MTHAMAFFRNPEQRLISAYLYGQHEWPAGRAKASNAREFAQVVNGCVTKMFTRGHTFTQPAWQAPVHVPYEPCYDPALPTDAEVSNAKGMVQKMAFIGLTEEWDLSICLFHAMYGGDCAKSEFKNTRAGTKDSSQGYNVNEYLSGWTDKYDGPVYKAAEGKFWKHVDEFGGRQALEQSCEEKCQSS